MDEVVPRGNLREMRCSLVSLSLSVRGFNEPPAKWQPPCGLTRIRSEGQAQVPQRGAATRGHYCLKKSYLPRET